MTKTKPVRHGAKRLAAATMLLSLLGTAGCMTWHRAVTSAANDVETMIDPTIDPAEQATGKSASAWTTSWRDACRPQRAGAADRWRA